MKKVFILLLSFILNLQVKNANSLNYIGCKCVVFEREGDLKLNSDGTCQMCNYSTIHYYYIGNLLF